MGIARVTTLYKSSIYNKVHMTDVETSNHQVFTCMIDRACFPGYFGEVEIDPVQPPNHHYFYASNINEVDGLLDDLDERGWWFSIQAGV